MLDRIGNCRIEAELAAGGMAVVYRAVHETLGRPVAVKALKSAHADSEQAVARFEREARSLAALQHENLVHVYDFHRAAGSWFIVMELVEGIDLYDLLDRCGRLPFDIAAAIAAQVARALDYVHYRNLVHRDIKPANVMLSRQGAVKLMDFGIARARNLEDLTEGGAGVGTPAYMSPEQVLADKVDARSDLFSLGVVLYQMVTGRKPFVEDEERSVMHKIRLERHVPARKLNPSIPRELDRIIQRCLEKHPANRWRSAQHLLAALERFLSRHVELNYTARLVLFLRDQGVVSPDEASESVAASLDAAGGARAQANVQARHAVQRAAVVHASVLTVMVLMLALLHVAPLGDRAAVAGADVPRGRLVVAAHPWARVAVDGRDAGVTPLEEPLALPVGTHRVRLEHDWYAPVVRTVRITELDGTPDAAPVVLEVDFEATGTLRPGRQRPAAPSAGRPGAGAATEGAR